MQTIDKIILFGKILFVGLCIIWSVLIFTGMWATPYISELKGNHVSSDFFILSMLGVYAIYYPMNMAMITTLSMCD